MCHSWLNGSHLEKCVTLGKIGHISENGTHLEKWVRLEKMAHNW